MEEVVSTNIDFHRLNLTRESSYLPLPEWLSRKKAIINPKNDDLECFKWAIIAADKWKEIGNNPERVSKLRKFEDEYDWNGVEFLFATKSIGKFEDNNRMCVNLLAIESQSPGEDKKRIFILRKSTKDYDKVVNLILINGENCYPNEKRIHNRNHYVAIKCLSRLLSSMDSKSDKVCYHCTNCLHGFPNEVSKRKHEEYCIHNDAARIEIPTKFPFVKYSKGQYQLKVPFVMYADFELLLVPNEDENSNVVNVHEPSGWCVKTECVYNANGGGGIELYRGKDCVEKFCKHIVNEAKRLYQSYPEVPMKPLMRAQKREHLSTKSCHICLKKLSIDSVKVRDHCHFTGEYRGAAHNICNLRYKVPNYIPVVFHNLSGYDAHLFIQELGKHIEKVGVIAKNEEDYISFSTRVKVGEKVDKNGVVIPIERELRFIDSFKFMSSSLDSLVNNLSRGDHRFKGLEGYMRKQRELLIRKGVYPYEYMDSWEKFEEDCLPGINKFYSKLNNIGIKEDDYKQAMRVWNEFGLKI